MGNSEVGHLTIGSGRVIYQDLSRINRAIANGSFFDNPVLWSSAADQGAGRVAPSYGAAVRRRRALSHGPHQSARAADEPGRMDRVFIHAYTDGRDTQPTSSIEYVKDLEAFLQPRAAAPSPPSPAATTPWTETSAGIGWKLAYDALVHGEGLTAPSRPQRPGIL